MKFSKLTFVALVAASVLVGCKQENKEGVVEGVTETIEAAELTPATEVAGTVEKATFQIEGMTCALGCAKMIESKLSGLSGVQSAAVDFDTKTATVVFDDAKQNVESITATVEKIANNMYSVQNFEVTEIASVK